MRGMTVDTAHPPGSWTFVTDPGGHTEPPGPPEPPDLTDALHHARHGHQPGFVTLYRDLQPRLLTQSDRGELELIAVLPHRSWSGSWHV